MTPPPPPGRIDRRLLVGSTWPSAKINGERFGHDGLIRKETESSLMLEDGGEVIDGQGSMKLTSISGALSWLERREFNPWLFPLPSELAVDPGPIGVIFRRVPMEILRDADRCPEPFVQLGSVRLFKGSGFPELLRGCNSVLVAADRLIDKVYNRGSLIQRATRVRTHAEAAAVNKQLFPSLYRTGAETLRISAALQGPAMLREFNKQEATVLSREARKRGRSVIIPRTFKPTAKSLRQAHPLEYLMLLNWIRWGRNGIPGLMFFSDTALANLFWHFDWNGFPVDADRLNSEQIEKMRGRLGLRKANAKNPLVTDVRVDDRIGELKLITAPARDAQVGGEKDTLSLTVRIGLEGRILYAGSKS